MQSKATTVREYLASLAPERRAAIEVVREVILRNLDSDYEEGMAYGMIGYSVPHRVYPDGYHCDPRLGLPFAALASQKNHMSLYLTGVCDCVDGMSGSVCWFHEAWAATGKKLERGCIRFQKVEDLALDVLGEAIRSMPARLCIEKYEKSRAMSASGSKGAGQKKAPASKRRASIAGT